jgi:hypothetical protein
MRTTGKAWMTGQGDLELSPGRPRQPNSLNRTAVTLCRVSMEAGKTPAAVRGWPGRARPRTRKCSLRLGLSTGAC